MQKGMSFLLFFQKTHRFFVICSPGEMANKVFSVYFTIKTNGVNISFPLFTARSKYMSDSIIGRPFKKIVMEH